MGKSVRSRMWIVLSATGLFAGACSLVNAPADPEEPGTGGATTQGGGGSVPDCNGNAECASLSDECNDGVCAMSACQAVPKAEGTPCGDSTASECNAADACDAAGTCQPNVAPNGQPCIECPAGVGQCAGCQDGTCPDCADFATEKTFVRDSSILGWELTGGFGLYLEAPQNHLGPDAIAFDSLVFGTDGNRISPYPGNENEVSYARTAPSVLPAALTFLSWHVDEGGGGLDSKRISLSIDGGQSWTPVADCNAGGALSAFPFCQNVPDRAHDAWDSISITVPPAMVGQLGIVELAYDTGDPCCAFERGWFIDRINFATDCACGLDAQCAFATDACGTGSCFTGTGECRVTPAVANTACGDASGPTECDAPDSCDGFGHCRPHHAPDSIDCFDCMGGVDECRFCVSGLCEVCMLFEPTNTFDTAAHILGWELTGGWARYQTVPISQMYTTTVTFGTTAFGTDGNRVPPYPGNETEISYARTTAFVVPSQITFQSWHVDEGAAQDVKRINLSTDGGMTWTPLVDCTSSGLNGYPFCQTLNINRTATQWDAITIDTSAHAGQIGRLEFTYDTTDNCCDFERGWYINDLNVLERCLDM